MKKISVFLTVSCIALFYFLGSLTFASGFFKDDIPVSIEKLISDNKIKVDFSGKGGHSGYCMLLVIENISADTQYVQLEAGRRLFSVDSSLQDIFIVKDNVVAVPPFQKVETSGYGFCCQSSNRSPYNTSKFTIGTMAPVEWQILADVINKNDFPEDAIQAAVWCISNDHPVSSIYWDDMDKIKLLRKTVAEIKNEEIPWYFTTYIEDTAQVFTNKRKNIEGELSFYLNSNAVVSILVRDSHGLLVSTPLKETALSSGTHKFNFKQSVTNWKEGEYTIYIIEDFSRVIQRKKFRL